MADLDETAVFDEGVYQIEETDPVLGGAPNITTKAGLSNIPHWQLARRTRWLKNAYDTLAALVVNASTTVAGIVQLENSLTSTSTSRALTAAQGKILQDAKAPLVSPGLSGTPTAPTAPTSTNTTQIANCAFVKAVVAALVNSSPEALDTLNELAAALGNDPNFATTVTNALAAKAPTASPTFTGAPAAPTPAAAESSTRLATTEWVRQNVMPAGCVASFAMATAPAGWLPCDGAAVSRATYAGLFAAIGTTYGAGNGTTTFNVPDLRGEFVRGVDGGRGVDTDRVFGSAQGGESNRLTQFETARNPAGEQGNVVVNVPSDGNFSPWAASGRSMDGDDVNIRFKLSGSETRPRNIALLYCVKF